MVPLVLTHSHLGASFFEGAVVLKEDHHFGGYPPQKKRHRVSQPCPLLEAPKVAVSMETTSQLQLLKRSNDS